MIGVFIFYCCFIFYHKFMGLNNTNIILHFCMSEIKIISLSKVEVISRPVLLLETLRNSWLLQFICLRVMTCSCVLHLHSPSSSCSASTLLLTSTPSSLPVIPLPACWYYRQHTCDYIASTQTIQDLNGP